MSGSYTAKARWRHGDRHGYALPVIHDERLRAIRAASNLPLAAILRLACVASAEERSRRVRGRPLTTDELRRVVDRYRGD